MFADPESTLRHAPRRAAAIDRALTVPPRSFSRSELYVLTAITLLAAVLRLLRLGEWSFWVDEAHTYRDVVKPAAEFWQSEVANYPLSYLLLRGLIELGMPTSEGWLRLPSAFLGILSVPVLGLVGRSMVGARAALVAAALLAVSPWHVFWSQTARSYAMVLFFVLVAAATFYRGMLRRQWQWLVLSLALTVVAGLCHPSAYLVLAGYVTFSLALLRRRDVPISRLRRWMPLLVMTLLAALLIVLFPLLQHVRRVKPDFSLIHLLETLGFFVRLPLVVAAVGGALWLSDRDDPVAPFLTSWVVAPLLALAALALGVLKVTAQYAFYTLPAFCLLAASIVTALAERVSGVGFRGYLLRAVPLLILLLDMTGQSFLYFARYHGERPRWREVRHFLMGRPGDAKRVLTTNQPSLIYYLNPQDFAGGFAGEFEVEKLADYVLRDAGGGTKFLEAQIAATRARHVELYVVITEPELQEMDPQGEVDAYLRRRFVQVRWLPNWTGPKDMSILIYHFAGD